ncbi:hypothetical protein N0V90_011020 [Kalmusia sp. IMI 367209]|nr:hypothetical protein N0V90_011020 [Kalmusia sp. IMI 367209]
MTTYFYHNPDGSVTGYMGPVFLPVPYSHPNTNDVYIPPSYRMSGLPSYLAHSSTWQSTLAPVVPSSGIIDYRNTRQAASTGSNDAWHETDGGSLPEEAQDIMNGSHVCYSMSGNIYYGIQASGSWSVARCRSMFHEYPDTDQIRNYLTLHTLLPWIQPERLRNAIEGPTLDILEEGTLHKFAVAVPKKMLVLFCGRKVIKKFLRTTAREDDENWTGDPVTQELRIPPGFANHIGVKIMVAWMNRACRGQYKNKMKPVRVPKNTFAALSLSMAFTTFALHRDAARVDNFIADHHYKRPLFPDEIISIWNCLPKDSKYTYRMIENLRKQLVAYEDGNNKALPDAKKVVEFLENDPSLKARVDDKEFNNSERFLPFFGTDWCVKAAIYTQQLMAGLVSSKTEDQVTAPPRVHSGHQTSQKANGHSQSRHYSQPRPQLRKHAVALSDWKPKAPPAAWPQFDKTYVLKIVEAKDKLQDFPSEKIDSAHNEDDVGL